MTRVVLVILVVAIAILAWRSRQLGQRITQLEAAQNPVAKAITGTTLGQVVSEARYQDARRANEQSLLAAYYNASTLSEAHAKDGETRQAPVPGQRCQRGNEYVVNAKDGKGRYRNVLATLGGNRLSINDMIRDRGVRRSPDRGIDIAFLEDGHRTIQIERK